MQNHDRDVPFHLLEEVPELSFGDRDSGNLIVQGDNLVALKSLLPYYAGKVKCIYIDPPYNTGNENWVYNDNVNDPEIKTWLGNVVGKEAEDLSRHDKWLCMMYPRLKLLREFLRQDGSIWISIDDNEVYYLKMMLDEIFGSAQFIFWLQTSTDRFYPDFVCKLVDGRILVVEYKGHHLYSNEDSKEKRIIGEAWAKLSRGRCLFHMTDGPELEPLKQLLVPRP